MTDNLETVEDDFYTENPKVNLLYVKECKVSYTTYICTKCNRDMTSPGFDGCANGDKCPHGYEICW